MVGVFWVLGVALGSALEDVKQPFLSRGLSYLFFRPMRCIQNRAGSGNMRAATYEACLRTASVGLWGRKYFAELAIAQVWRTVEEERYFATLGG